MRVSKGVWDSSTLPITVKPLAGCNPTRLQTAQMRSVNAFSFFRIAFATFYASVIPHTVQ